METIRADLCIIGAGAAGLSLAAGASQMGARVVLVEAGEMGGDCLNAGCVPSKALLAAAKAAKAQRHPGVPGVAPVEPAVDFAAVMGHVRATIAHIAPNDSQERFEALGVRVIRARGEFVSGRELRAGGALIRARRFAVATGSAPAVPPIPGLAEAGFLTNETIFGLTARPEHLLILGGGPIGVEMAQAFRRLGTRVSLVEAAPRILGREDEAAAALVRAQLAGEGVEIAEGQAVVRVAPGPVLHLADGRAIAGSHLLVAVGRRPVTEGLGLEAAGVAHDGRGITVDGRLRSTNRRIFAMGDVAGQGQFTHLAGHHAGVVFRQALLALPTRAAPKALPRVTYCDPELAQVGLTEAEARQAHGAALTISRADFAHNDRAIAEARDEGFVKLMLVRGRLVGVTVVGREAGELIGLWALVLGARIRLSAVAGMIAPYPTRGESAKRAAGAFFAPKLFANPWLRRVVRLVQAVVP